jgi:hypothetical protein
MDGELCQAPALRDKRFCYYHEYLGPQLDIDGSNPAAPVHLPLLEDAVSIQSAIKKICEYLLERRIEPKKAGVLLYAMQVATSNLARVNADKNEQKKSSKESSAKTDEAEPAQPDSSQPNPLPPGTIQACAAPRRSVV